MDPMIGGFLFLSSFVIITVLVSTAIIFHQKVWTQRVSKKTTDEWAEVILWSISLASWVAMTIMVIALWIETHNLGLLLGNPSS